MNLETPFANIDAQLGRGELSEALANTEAHIRQHPDDLEARASLAQILALLGQWERTAKQMHALHGGQGYKAFCALYLGAIDAEQKRLAVWAGQQQPSWLGQPQPWHAQWVQALALGAQNKHEDAAVQRAQASTSIVAQAGQVDGQAFTWLHDMDSRMGPVFEAIVNGRYGWFGPGDLASIRFYPVATPFDLVWRQALITLSNQLELPALVPVRYPGSEAHGHAFALGRKTEWQALGQNQANQATGIGQRMLWSEDQDFALLDVTCIEFTLQQEAIQEEATQETKTRD